jgi:hypothetical protein
MHLDYSRSTPSLYLVLASTIMRVNRSGISKLNQLENNIRISRTEPLANGFEDHVSSSGYVSMVSVFQIVLIRHIPATKYARNEFFGPESKFNAARVLHFSSHDELNSIFADKPRCPWLDVYEVLSHIVQSPGFRRGIPGEVHRLLLEHDAYPLPMSSSAFANEWLDAVYSVLPELFHPRRECVCSCSGPCVPEDSIKAILQSLDKLLKQLGGSRESNYLESIPWSCMCE